MIREAMNKIVELSQPVEFEFNGRKYTSKSIKPIHEPEPAPLVINTLTGLKDYFDTNPDDLDYERLLFQVVDAKTVLLIGPIFGQFDQRKCYLRTIHTGDAYPYDAFLDPETFIIKLQAMFQQDETTARLLSIVGNIKDEKVTTVGDDGITQQVTARAGIARVENISLPNPITLTPYRTFLEADQPSSQFVFRMRSGAAESPATCALFKADGGRWKLKAMQNIKKWLQENIETPIQVLA
ncbi:MAG: hypothetical protein HGJ93_00585 [Desulfosarcina sp.]|nr:hypothetical protein [Desulfosarcina sp.]MBC2764482.1 hypothetical protein [Desulfosarcina sp.]